MNKKECLKAINEILQYIGEGDIYYEILKNTNLTEEELEIVGNCEVLDLIQND